MPPSHAWITDRTRGPSLWEGADRTHVFPIFGQWLRSDQGGDGVGCWFDLNSEAINCAARSSHLEQLTYSPGGNMFAPGKSRNPGSGNRIAPGKTGFPRAESRFAPEQTRLPRAESGFSPEQSCLPDEFKGIAPEHTTLRKAFRPIARLVLGQKPVASLFALRMPANASGFASPARAERRAPVRLRAHRNTRVGPTQQAGRCCALRLSDLTGPMQFRREYLTPRPPRPPRI